MHRHSHGYNTLDTQRNLRRFARKGAKLEPLKTIGRFEIPGKLPSLNQVIAKNRGNTYAGNKMKQDTERQIALCIRVAQSKGDLAKHYDDRVVLVIDWYEHENRRDADNIKSANKFILDALVKTGVLTDDGPKFVRDIIGAVHYPMYDNQARIQRVKVRICKEAET